MRNQRRRFGDWELYTGHPATLGCSPPNACHGFIYHVKLSDCQTQEGYEDWVRHLEEKMGFDVSGFKLAIKTLRAEGYYLKPIDGEEGKGGTK